MIILNNIDELFEKEDMAHGTPRGDIQEFNSGLLVVEPNKKHYDGLLKNLEELNLICKEGGIRKITRANRFGDQDVMVRYFKEYLSNINKKLSLKYNIFASFLDENNVLNKNYDIISHVDEINKNPNGFNVIHFMRNKPWDFVKNNIMVDFKIKKQSSRWNVSYDKYKKIYILWFEIYKICLV